MGGNANDIPVFKSKKEAFDAVFYQKIKDAAVKTPEKPVFLLPDEKAVSYQVFLTVYDEFRSFVRNAGIESRRRIILISKDTVLQALLMIPIMENAVFSPVRPDMPLESRLSLIDLYKTDYILTDHIDKDLEKAVLDRGIGIIMAGLDENHGRASFGIVHDLDKTKHEQNQVKTPDQTLLETTSGTTDKPKVVPTVFTSEISYIIGESLTYEMNADDVILSTVHISKSSGFNTVLYAAHNQCTVILTDDFNHNMLIDILERFKVTFFTVPPVVMESLVELLQTNNIKIKADSLRFIRLSGAPLTKKLRLKLVKIFGCEIVQSYGIHECRNISNTYKAPKGYKEGSVGISRRSEIKISDGEIWVGGDTIFRGYENSDSDKSEYLTEGWFHTGDLGYIDEDGYIFITGRKKELINRGGEKVSPYEVEAALLAHPDIDSAAIFPYPGGNGMEEVGAAVVLKGKTKMDLNEIRRFLSKKLAAFKLPSLAYFVDSIPSGENNKVKRSELFQVLDGLYPEVIKNRHSKKVSDRQLTPNQIILMRIWRKHLKRKDIGTDDGFMAAGGDSLSGAAVLSDIENKLKTIIPSDLLFNDGTISKLAEYIENNNTDDVKFDFLRPLNGSGKGKPLICVHSALGDATTYRHIGKNMNAETPVYALRFDFKKGNWRHPLSFAQISEKYIEDIKKLDPEGPYFLCGNCWGGVLAYKIASDMLERGERVGMLAMFDSASKHRNDKPDESNEKLSSKIAVALKDSISQLRGYGFSGKFKIIMKKISNISSLVLLTQNKKIYSYGARVNNRFLMKLMGKSGALGHAYRNYIPGKYEGKVHYFKATMGRSGTQDNYRFWQGLSKNFELIEMDCHHNDMIIGETSEILAGRLYKIMNSAGGNPDIRDIPEITGKS